MTHPGEALFARYAPEDSPWSPWAKPVLFASALSLGSPEPEPLAQPDVAWAPAAGRGAIVVVDLRGDVAVAGGLALARRGYRPVPLFNGVPGAEAAVDVRPILRALRDAGSVLEGLRLASDAPPAFLLDANRAGRGHRPLPGHFDNRWVVFPQDFPSATLLRSRRIDEAIVWTEAGARPAQDLCHVLRRWQEGGIRVLRQAFGADGPPEVFDVPRPPSYRAAWYRVLALLGLGRAAVGGFGSRIPVPAETRPGFYG